MEDVVRAYDCSLPRIRREYVSRFNYSDEEKEEEADWIGNIIAQMNREGCREKGHLKQCQQVMQTLEEKHKELIDNDEAYRAQYYRVLPFIVELRKKGSHKDVSELETCFDALYGTMLLRLQHKDISPETQHAIEQISTLIAQLATDK